MNPSPRETITITNQSILHRTILYHSFSSNRYPSIYSPINTYTIESEIVDFLIIARSKSVEGEGGPWHKIEIDFVRPLLLPFSKQLVGSVVSMYFSFSLSLFSCNFIRARPCSRHVFAREANNRGIMVYGRERVVDSRLRKRGVSRAETGKPG